MELLQLKYFCDAAQTENFSKTASKYHVPPSNISQSIKRLEGELGIKLFDRKTNCLTLNQSGKNFCIKVKEALNILENAKAEATDSNDKGVLKICIMTNRLIVTDTIEKFAKKYPDIVISSSYNLSADFEDFDIIISDDNFKSDNTEREMIVSEEISLAINTENTLALKTEITGEDLAKENFICMNEDSSLFSITKKICNNMNFQPNIVMQSPDPVFIRKCVDLNLGITFVPTISWQGQFSDKVVLKKLGKFYRTTYAYKNKNKFNKKSIVNFIEMLKQDFA
ncbi:MAG: LysR family transcriptional regulator [Clostridia bacterium]|nr:LysR family transcriptional regulator [Clostridia bacterium]